MDQKADELIDYVKDWPKGTSGLVGPRPSPHPNPNPNPNVNPDVNEAAGKGARRELGLVVFSPRQQVRRDVGRYRGDAREIQGRYRGDTARPKPKP